MKLQIIWRLDYGSCQKQIIELKYHMPCYFCQRNIEEIDFKNTELLKRFISSLGKIKPRRKTGTCASHQRQLARAIKRARRLGLLSAVKKD